MFMVVIKVTLRDEVAIVVVVVGLLIMTSERGGGDVGGVRGVGR
jgi:hypothetical protein